MTAGAAARPAGAPTGIATGAGAALGGILTGVAIVATIFNDLKAALPVGELASDAFIYVFPFLLLYLLRAPGRVELPIGPLLIALGLYVVIILGIALNYDAISRAYFKGRGGMGRVITQLMSLSFGLLVALIFYNLTRAGQLPAMSRGARIALGVMAGVGVLEFASWHGLPGLTQLYDALSRVIHSQSGLAYARRLRMTAFEVSWAGVMLSFLFPFGMITLGRGAWRAGLYLGLVLLLVVLAQSRTALLVILFQAAIFGWFAIRGRADHILLLATLGVLAAFALLLSPGPRELIGGKVSNMIHYGSLSGPEGDTEENVSNVTRLAAINAGMEMFHEHPLLGVGFGQYGFGYPSHLQADDFRSWEVRLYAADGEDLWPPVFSLHVRFLAETGIIGYALWLLLLGPPILRSFRASDMTSLLGRSHLAVAMTLGGWMLLGLSIDSARFFGGWIALGVGLALPSAGGERALRAAASPAE